MAYHKVLRLRTRLKVPSSRDDRPRSREHQVIHATQTTVILVGLHLLYCRAHAESLCEKPVVTHSSHK